MPEPNRTTSEAASTGPIVTVTSIALAWLLTRLPYDTQLRLGRRFGGAFHRLVAERRRIALGNIAVALPGLDAEAREALARESFRQFGMSLAETAHVWFGRRGGVASRFRFEGGEHFERARASGQGTILLRARFSCVDAAAREMGMRWPIATVFRASGGALEQRFTRARRERHVDRMIENDDVRGVVRALLAGESVWYSPDEHLPLDRGGVAGRMFGQSVCTGGGTARLARLGRADVVPFVTLRERREDGRWGYVVRFSAPLALDGLDLAAATQRVNDVFERQVYESPEQYLWMNRRFVAPSAAGAPSADRSMAEPDARVPVPVAGESA